MGKKYLNTKKGSIEQSILDVWQEAADMHAEGMDGRTKEYRSHRGKLETNRDKRENKKSSVKTELPETQHGSGEHAYEVGTDRYAEYTAKITPGQIQETFLGLGPQVNDDGLVVWSPMQEALIEQILDMSDDHYDDLLEEMSYEQLIVFEGIMKAIGKGLGKVGRAIGKRMTSSGRAEVGAAKIKKKQATLDTKIATKKAKKDYKQKKKEAGIGIAGKLHKGKEAIKKVSDKVKGAVSDVKSGAANDGGKKVEPKAETDPPKKKKKDEPKTKTENLNLRDTIKNLWIEAAAAAVDPKEREELDLSPEDTAKKMKRAKEPGPNVSEAYKPIKSNHYDVKVTVDARDVEDVEEFIKNSSEWNKGNIEDLDTDGVSGGGMTFKGKGDIYIQGDGAGSLGVDLQKEFRRKVKVMGESRVYEREELGEGTKEEYQKFFQGALKKFKIKSPAELKSDEEKKKFFDYVDKNYTGEKDEEKIEEKIELAKEFKVSSMRHALEKVWSVAEGELPPALKKAIAAKKKDKEEDEDYHDDDEEKGNTLTGKKKAAVDVNPHQGSR